MALFAIPSVARGLLLLVVKINPEPHSGLLPGSLMYVNNRIYELYKFTRAGKILRTQMAKAPEKGLCTRAFNCMSVFVT